MLTVDEGLWHCNFFFTTVMIWTTYQRSAGGWSGTYTTFLGYFKSDRWATSWPSSPDTCLQKRFKACFCFESPLLPFTNITNITCTFPQKEVLCFNAYHMEYIYTIPRSMAGFYGVNQIVIARTFWNLKCSLSLNDLLIHWSSKFLL